ncbi:MAG: sugar phosphate isomerase/epimerase family protein [Chitinophagia bacterium]|jgi:D-psicose/D-tagatose/L-ribulose 3-epimerase
MLAKYKFAVSSWLFVSPFTTESIEPIFEKVAQLGYDAIEIAVEDPELIDAEKVAIALRKYHLTAVVCGAFGSSRDLTSHDPAIHQQCFDYIEACLKLCNQWGTNFLAGPMYSAVGKRRMLSSIDRRKEWDLAVKNVRIACEMAAQHHCQLAIEPINRFETDLVNTAADVCKLVQDIKHPAAKISLDSFHMNMEEKNPTDAILQAGNNLIHMQISENHRGIPGTGTTPWDQYAAGLNKINYQGVISVESFTPMNQQLAEAVCIWKPLADSQEIFAQQGLNFMKKTFK